MNHTDLGPGGRGKLVFSRRAYHTSRTATASDGQIFASRMPDNFEVIARRFKSANNSIVVAEKEEEC